MKTQYSEGYGMLVSVTQPCGTVSEVNVQVVLSCVCTLYIHEGHVGLEQYDAVFQYKFPNQIQLQRLEHVH